jgi:hypothetical protein
MVCSPSFLCSGGACAVDPASRWNVVLDSLEVASTEFTGLAWDPLGGAPDPIVQVRVVSDTAIPVVENGPDDVFSITYTAAPRTTNVRASDLLTLLRFDVFDEDSDANDFIGACRVSASTVTAAFSESSQFLNCPPDESTRNSGFTLGWHLERF